MPVRCRHWKRASSLRKEPRNSDIEGTVQGSTLTASGREASREFGRTQEICLAKLNTAERSRKMRMKEVLVRCCIREGMGDFSESGFR